MDKEKALTIWLPVIADGVKNLPECKESLEMAIEALENQKTGHWEETTLANGRKGMKCSNCGCEPIEDALYGYVYSDYCPSCGTKMEGESK